MSGYINLETAKIDIKFFIHIGRNSDSIRYFVLKLYNVTHFVLAHKNRIIFCLYNLYVHRTVAISYKNAMVKKKLNRLSS